MAKLRPRLKDSEVLPRTFNKKPHAALSNQAEKNCAFLISVIKMRQADQKYTEK